MKVLVRAPMSEVRLNELNDVFDEVIYDPWNKTGERYYEDKMIAVLQEVQPDILITELDRITDKVLCSYDKLKVIGDCRATPANIDIEACSTHQIPVLCTPARNAVAVAEMLVGLLISYMRNVLPSVEWVKQNHWIEGTTPYYTWMGNELHGKKIGFVGFGAVGKAAANLLEAFGCNVQFYDPYVESPKTTYKKCELEEIFTDCDIISIHLPVLPSTRRIINAQLLAKMKPSAIFVNTARSAVVDMKALEKVVQDGSIRGAILDVLDSEPPTERDLELIKHPNVLLTPHICGATYEVTDHQSDIIMERLKKWIKQKDLQSIVYNATALYGEHTVSKES